VIVARAQFVNNGVDRFRGGVAGGTLIIMGRGHAVRIDHNAVRQNNAENFGPADVNAEGK
jgi:hypothetical protein